MNSLPEEDDVVAGLEERAGVEQLELPGLLGPTEHGEGEEPRREPRVQDVLILREGDLGAVDAQLLGGLVEGVVARPAGDPVLVVGRVGRVRGALDAGQVDRDSGVRFNRKFVGLSFGSKNRFSFGLRF